MNPYSWLFKTLNPEQEYVTISMGRAGRTHELHLILTVLLGLLVSLDEATAPGQDF